MTMTITSTGDNAQIRERIDAVAQAIRAKDIHALVAHHARCGGPRSGFGFSDKANLDDAAMWPVALALKALTATEETRIVALVKQAAS